MDSGRDTLAGGFPHSEISGSTLDCQLPGAFRRLSRLSSPVVAKASTVCACSLDPITRNPVDAPHGRGSGFALYVTFAARDRSRALLRTFHIVKEQSRLEPRSRRRRPEPISNAIALHGTCKINQSINQQPQIRRPSAMVLDIRSGPGGVVEPGGFEPPTPGLQSRRSPG
jgi:hypothetical protein